MVVVSISLCFPSQLYDVPGLGLSPFLEESQMDYLIYSPLAFCTFIRPSHLLHRIL